MGPRRREPSGGGGIISGSRLEGGRGLILAKGSPRGDADVVVGLFAACCGNLKFAAGGSFGEPAVGCVSRLERTSLSAFSICGCALCTACASAARRRISSRRASSLICACEWDVRCDFPPGGSSWSTHCAPPELYLTIDLMRCPNSSPLNDSRPHRHDCIAWCWAVKYQLNRSGKHSP
jgi:hypothetical protein